MGLDQPAVREPQAAPYTARPQPFSYRDLCRQHGPIARVRTRHQVRWSALLDNPARLDDQHAVECLRGAYVVRNAQQSGVPPLLAGAGYERVPLRPVEAAERLIQD